MKKNSKLPANSPKGFPCSLVIGTSLVAFALFIFFWKVPKWQVVSARPPSLERQFELENSARLTLVQALGGVFFFVTSCFTWRNLKVAEDKQITERFGKAIELLGSDGLEVRLGGIYMLERLAKDSPKDHWTVIEVLSSFVREKSPRIEQQEVIKKVSTDIQAALTVISRRQIDYDPPDEQIDLSFTSLCGANLIRAQLSKSNLIAADLREAHLNEANFEGADLSDINLYKGELNRANLTGAFLNRANLQWSKLISATLTGAVLNEANLEMADLSGADLSNAWLFKTVLYRTLISRTRLSNTHDLTVEQIKTAYFWDQAIYSESLKEELHLPSNDNE